MLKLSIKDLRVGMIFSGPLLTEKGTHLLDKRIPIDAKTVIQWISKGYNTLMTRGSLVGGDPNAERVVEIIQRELMALKQRQYTQPTEVKEEVKNTTVQSEPLLDENYDSSKSKINLPENILKAGDLNKRVEALNYVEQIVDNLSFGMSQFLQNPLNVDELREKIVISSERVMKGLKNSPEAMLDIISFANPGDIIVSHSVRVAVVGVFMGMQMGADYKRLLCIAAAAYLHDIGKVAYTIVNDVEGIVVDPAKLNIHLTHPVYGYKVAKNFLNFQDEVCQAIINHHEQPDGQGYPRRVGNDKLFITDKILYTANVFSHLVEKNNYQGFLKPFENIKYLASNYPEKFDKDTINYLQGLDNLQGYEALSGSPAGE